MDHKLWSVKVVESLTVSRQLQEACNADYPDRYIDKMTGEWLVQIGEVKEWNSGLGLKIRIELFKSIHVLVF